MKKIIVYSFIVTFIIISVIFIPKLIKRTSLEQRTSALESQETKSEATILYYTCGMHPQTRVSVEEYNKGKTKDPICGMDLIPVYKTEEVGENVIKLSGREISLAGIETFKAEVLPLFKEIRTVGVVAYDPGLRVAEEEYIQALNTYEKISQSGFKDARERAREILEAAKLKLELLGLTPDWIQELESNRVPHKSLILPQQYMWIYADIYEYEAIWPRIGDKAEIVSEVDPSVVLEGEVKSIEPVIEEKTRVLRLKMVVENINNILKPNMYVDVFLKSDLGEVLSIPKEAVLDTGKRKIAYVDLGEGRYQLREVKVGPFAQGVLRTKKVGFYPILEGIEEGEEVVLKGNYLLDSQSQLGAAGAVYGGALEVEEGKTKAPGGHRH